jgi:hypothetical protein
VSGVGQHPPLTADEADGVVLTALRELERQGIAECVDGKWQLTELGRQRRDAAKAVR